MRGNGEPIIGNYDGGIEKDAGTVGSVKGEAAAVLAMDSSVDKLVPLLILLELKLIL